MPLKMIAQQVDQENNEKGCVNQPNGSAVLQGAGNFPKAT
jgi:hypothetical protein